MFDRTQYRPARALLVLAGVVVAAGALALVLLHSGESTAMGPSSDDPVPLRAFSVFDDPHVSRLDAADALKLATALSRVAPLDPETARVAVRDASHTVSVIGGPNVVCLKVNEVGGSGSTSCSSAELAATDAHPMGSVSVLGAGWRVTFLLNDDASNPIVVTRDGAQHPVPLENNVASTLVADPPARFAFQSPSGTKALDLGLATEEERAPPGPT